MVAALSTRWGSEGRAAGKAVWFEGLATAQARRTQRRLGEVATAVLTDPASLAELADLTRQDGQQAGERADPRTQSSQEPAI
jgi:predicted transcriptional regulator